ncbi:MAG: HAD family hydrolase [Alphaproteobacteria bacterium]|nr:HAD family hydrolase [Alphaproteobacteria bacterium]
MSRRTSLQARFTSPPASAVNFSMIDLVMFDMDGTLIDTADLQHSGWSAALNPVFEEHGQAPLTRDECLVHLNGQSPEVGVPPLLKARGLTDIDIDLDAVGEEKSRYSKQWLDTPGNTVRIHDDVFRLALDLRSAGKIVVVVSSSRSARQMLDKLGILKDFDFVMDGSLRREFNLRAKPEPDTLEYTRQRCEKETARKLPPNRCAMIGDTSADMRAAHAMTAGLIIGFNPERNSSVAQSLKRSGAHLVLTNMRDVPGFPPTMRIATRNVASGTQHGLEQ